MPWFAAAKKRLETLKAYGAKLTVKYLTIIWRLAGVQADGSFRETGLFAVSCCYAHSALRLRKETSPSSYSSQVYI